MATFTKYNLEWQDGTDPLQIELYCIRRGKAWVESQGRKLVDHYTAAKRLIWPELDEHRWQKLCFENMVEHKTCVLLGCASSGKTHTGSLFALLYYFASPDDTCVLVSSTTMPSLRKRVWAEITMLWEQAVQRYDWLPGNLLDSAVAITTDSVDDFEYGERKARSMRKGIFGVACVQGGKFVGLSRFMGIKQTNLLLLADEASAMAEGFLSSVANLNANAGFRAVVMGNPNDLHDPLGKCSEPLGGWTEEHLEPSKTTVWKTRFLGGVCVNLVGYDSPNFDFPEDQPTRYKYLISKEKINEVLSFFPEDSAESYAMLKGVMKIGTVAKRILSREMCERFGALTHPIWLGKPLTRVYFVDAAYNGDRCVAGWGEFGEAVDGSIILSFDEPKIIPVTIGSGREPEEIIAQFVREDCEANSIPPENMGHDSTGRGSLGTFLARAWSAKTHPIEAGGKPTDRPVSLDLFVDDEKTGQRRLKRCDEHFDRLVSEFHFAVRHAVESGQLRSLPEEAMDEFIARKWERLRERYCVEPKSGTAHKPGFKQRFGKSPDMADWVCGIVEMARRKGFRVAKLAQEPAQTKKTNWLTKAIASAEKLRKSRTLRTA